MSCEASKTKTATTRDGPAGSRSTIRTERRCDLMTSVMNPAPTGRVLEIGCGRGEIARLLGSKTGCTCSVSTSRRASYARRGPQVEDNVTFDVLDFTHPDEMMGRKFDYVVGNGILHHLYYDLPAALQSMRSLLSNGGRIIFLEPNLHNPYVYLIFSRPKLRQRARLEPDEMAFSRRPRSRASATPASATFEVEYRDFLVPGVPEPLIRPIDQRGPRRGAHARREAHGPVTLHLGDGALAEPAVPGAATADAVTGTAQPRQSSPRRSCPRQQRLPPSAVPGPGTTRPSRIRRR